MEDLSKRLEVAKTDNRQMEKLIQDYLPFIKSEIAAVSAHGLEYDDKLSLGMLVFMNCVRQYQPARGGFISYTSVCLRNRLLDEARRCRRVTDNTIVLPPVNDENLPQLLDDAASVEQYNRSLEQQCLREEIIHLSAELAGIGLDFQQLARIGPKQKRSRHLCAQLAQAVCRDADLSARFAKTRQLPQAQLSKQFGLSPKTIEKHRRYIVALIIIFSGDYPSIGAYVPGFREVQ